MNIKRQPSVFLIGAAKSGTTSLYHYFKLHPQLFLPKLKEPMFFATPECNGETGTIRDLDEYQKLYADCPQGSLAFDCSTLYLNVHASAERIHTFNPEARILVMLRHPVDRAFSAYSHLIRDGKETLEFKEALAAEPTRQDHHTRLMRYRELGHYTASLYEYERVFGKARMKVCLFDDFVRDPAVFMRDLYHFLGLEPVIPASFTPYNYSGKVRHPFLYSLLAKPFLLKTIAKHLLPEIFRENLKSRMLVHLTDKFSLPLREASILSDYYQPEIAKLESWLGRDLSEWKVRHAAPTSGFST